MRKFQSFAFAGAIALAGVAGLSACSSDDAAEAPLNPTFDGESVKTAFAINVAAPSKGGTRMTDENTQNKNNYLGMDNVRLLTLSSAPIDNQSLLSALALSTPSKVTPSRSSHIYSDVNIPVTTSNFLFYSTRAGLGETVDDKAATGAIVSDLFASNNNLKVANTSDISFSSEPIISTTNTISNEQRTFAAYLNKVLQTADASGNTWSSAADGSTLKQAYTNFTKTYTNAQRAGSADAVRLQMQALYNVAKPIADNANATDRELAKKLCENILNANAGSVTEIKFTANSGKLEYAADVSTKLSNFPGQQGLPEGAALLTYKNSSFAYVTSSPSIGQGDYKVNAYNITYPLPIVYFDNTPAKATNVEIADTDWKQNTSDWDATTTWTNWSDEVTATTRSIALKNNINYGVAGLKTIVKCDAAALEDNREANLTGQGNQSINVPTGGFEVTGILIGGQPNTVNWQFVNTSTDTRDYVVYDRITNNVKANSGDYSTNAIYTLVFDNWTKANNQETVYFALELKNGNVDFYGQEGLIAAGQKFYLIGKLDPKSPATSSSIWPTYPDTYEGTTNTLPKSYEGRYPVEANKNRVFIQDFTTLAQVNIKSLKNAYVTIPDLRASKLQLGLSVDLEWKNGLTFNVDL